MKKTLLMASVACACALAANAAYDSWFTGIGASASATNSMDESNGAWVFNVTNGEASVEVENDSRKLVFDLDDGETIVFNADQAAAPDTNTVTSVAVTGVFTPVKASDLPSDAEMNARGAQVGFVVGSANDVYNYYAWVGAQTGQEKGWFSIGSAIAAANIESETSLVVDFDYSHRNGAANYVTFKVGGDVIGSSSYEVTSTAGAAANAVAGMTCYGSGSLATANGTVEIGVAMLNGKKYASINDAVAAASGTAEISVVRPTNEAVTVNKAGITINDSNDIYTGNVAVSGDNITTTVKPAAVEFTGVELAGKSGTYTLKAGATDISKVEVELPMSNKEVASKTVSDGKVQVTIQTAKSVLAGATTDGGKALSVATAEKEAALRTFLNNNAQTAYEAADVSSTTIAAALNSTPENKNGLKLWQDYALGIAPEASVKPVPAPAGDTDTDAITLAIPDLAGATPSGDYSISYKVGDTTQVGGAGAIKIPLETGNKAVKVVFTP